MATRKTMLPALACGTALVLGALTLPAFTFADGPSPDRSGGAKEPQAAPEPEAHARPVVAPKDEVAYTTAEWKGKRYPDGRPKVSDDLLTRMKIVSIEQAWGTLEEHGYHNQYTGDWKTLHSDEPVIGRALTAQFRPSSPGLEKRLTKAGHAAGHDGQMNTWPIAMLRNHDVYVADGYGKTKDGTLIGGNLGHDIHARTHTGVVFDGSVRDVGELSDIKGFNAFVRSWHPSYIKEMMLAGVNTDIRIGKAVVLPGDVVLARREGVVFIPAHLAKTVVEEAESGLLRDTFVKQRLEEGKYTSGQVDKGWDEVDRKIKEDYRNWLQENKDKLPVPADRVEEIIEETAGA
ncbi:hypothetical protein MMF93_01810 [Streptomyces tubbatahanensis]|uniref:Uncharacterized protein n=1 Tax=Streptomyces tubbatahanensis TaxID=2923272 RepID=A0ABY3XLS0_9ACTN|nr:hypothetical protein [Streptomyces tubbatahanensis]UNS95344.1 hypothetical protein MMF93_01810 [Streptomyces tubbatahanensis]